MVLRFVFILLVFAASGCATVTSEQKAKWNETIPVCYTESDCKAKWAAARQWVQSNSGYKIQIYSDDLIETYNSQQYDTKIAVSVTKNPVAKSPEGEQINVISVRISCGNIFGCIPTTHESIMSFNKFVSQAEINDARCYQDMLKNLDKPKLGIYPQFFNTKYIIKRVCSDSPASKGGIKVNDVLTKVKGQSIDKQKDLEDALNKLDFGENVQLSVLRDDFPQEMTIKIPEKQEMAKLLTNKKIESKGNSSEIEQKLEALSRLLEKGIITKDEFDSKKKQLLSEI